MKKSLILLPLAVTFLPLFGDENPNPAPQWWETRNVVPSLADETTAERKQKNLNAANMGQLMNIARQARDEIAAKTGDAGIAINTMVDGFIANRTRTEDAPDRDLSFNLNVVNIGQLKHVAKQFYDRLWLIESSNPGAVTWPMGITFLSGGTDASNHKYPWPAIPLSTDSNYESEMKRNYAAAAIGQVKFLFSWSISDELYNVDSNGNGIPDGWERRHFNGQLVVNALANVSGDGISILDAYRLGLDPNVNNMDPSASGSAASEIIYDNNSMLIGVDFSTLERDTEGSVMGFGSGNPN